eukprot:scaffold51163_cov29-Tisochrysis_lutea.AAC.6
MQLLRTAIVNNAVISEAAAKCGAASRPSQPNAVCTYTYMAEHALSNDVSKSCILRTIYPFHD